MRNYTEEAKIFKALADENRLRILEILRGGEKCACVLLSDLQISQSTLSYHMKIPCDSGIVVRRPEGKWMQYAISKEGSLRAAQLLVEATALYGDGTSYPCGRE